jgi:hypothetical protein
VALGLTTPVIFRTDLDHNYPFVSVCKRIVAKCAIESPCLDENVVVHCWRWNQTSFYFAFKLPRMRKITIKNVVNFRKKSARGKKNFAVSLKVEKVKVVLEGGGDYWASCLSALSNGFRSHNFEIIENKILDLKKKLSKANSTKVQAMYKRNIEVLSNYAPSDLKKWIPTKKLNFLHKHKSDFILPIKGLPIEAKPHHVFTFNKADIEQVGSIWFIAQLGGYSPEELGMFADAQYRYLKAHFSKKYPISVDYCVAVDAFNNYVVHFSELKTGAVPKILDATLDEINKLT